MTKLFRFDWILLISAILLLALSLAVLYPISYDGKNTTRDTDHFFRQVMYAVFGLFVLFAFSFFDYRNLKGFSTALFFIGIFLLFLVLIFGRVIRGTTGWIGFSGIHIQPVEPFKIIIAIVLAKYFSLHSRTIHEFRHVFISMVPLAVSLLLIFLQPDLGSAIIILAVWASVLLASGVKKKHLLILIAIGIILSFFSWGFLLKDYQKDRIKTVFNPLSDPLGAGYNVIQSTVAIGSGGIWGKGLGHGSQSQLNFLPEKHTDFIFAVIAEELGLGGALFVLILFAVIITRMILIAQNSRSGFGKLLAGSFAMIIFAQAAINIGMNVGVMPVTGIPLPFLSYGGSSLFTTMAILGIVQNIHRNKESR
ncbi:MAG: rod shape-determining protein RodA [Patescibacteria group bacterium]|nr:rod shape-determining protein RodA [Patescibacteria group bacterium]